MFDQLRGDKGVDVVGVGSWCRPAGTAGAAGLGIEPGKRLAGCWAVPLLLRVLLCSVKVFCMCLCPSQGVPKPTQGSRSKAELLHQVSVKLNSTWNASLLFSSSLGAEGELNFVKPSSETASVAANCWCCWNR